MADTPMGNAIEFLDTLGVYEVILPFLLVFTLMFALLEKTKVLGTEKVKIDGDIHDVTRKNLNSMISLVIGFFVVASGQLVAIISEVLARMVVFIIIFFIFALTIGAFRKQSDEGFEVGQPWMIIFSISAFGALLFIFLDAVNVLDQAVEILITFYNNDIIISLVMLAALFGIILFITSKPRGSSNGEKDDK